MELSIRPYPTQYVSEWIMRDGTPVTLRPICPEDEPLMVRFHEGLSERSVYLRYFHLIHLSQRVAHERLTRICFVDYDREMALVAERMDAQTGMREILGVGRLTKLQGTRDAECAVLIADNYQRRGLGSELLRRIVEVGRAEGLESIYAEIMPENRSMQEICARAGFQLRHVPEDGVVRGILALRG